MRACPNANAIWPVCTKPVRYCDSAVGTIVSWQFSTQQVDDVLLRTWVRAVAGILPGLES
jgi:hypothetical protein